MPAWRTELPPEGKHTGFDLRRTPTSSSLVAVVTCDDILVCDTHFYHGRTTPCERSVNENGQTIDDSKCPACREKAGYRTHAYVSAFDFKRREHFLFECTANAAKPFAEYRAAATTLRGCSFCASRPKATPNGKVGIVTNAVNLAKVMLPEPPDLVKALCIIWRIPLPAIETGFEDGKFTDDAQAPRGKHKRAKVNTPPLNEMRQQPDNILSGTELETRRTQLLQALEATNNGNGKPQPKKAAQ
jgi:hypothetical protein